MTAQLDLAATRDAGSDWAARGQAAPAWPASCSWELSVAAVNGCASERRWKRSRLNRERVLGGPLTSHAAAPAHTHTHTHTHTRALIS